MNDIQLARYLGYFSLGLGALQLFASRRIARAVGVGNSTLVQAVGAREVAAGLMVLTAPDMSVPMWSRVAGDAMDAAVLVSGLGRRNRTRQATAGALLFVLGTAALDLAVATALTRREHGALQTARRTRVGASRA